MKIIRTNSQNQQYQTLVQLLDQELRQRNGDLQNDYDHYNLFTETVDVLLLTQNNEAIACGVIRGLKQDKWVELKRMFVRKNHRGQGHSKILIQALEKWAKEKGFEHIALETGTNMFEAIALYQQSGYQQIDNYEPYIGMTESICMKKKLH